MITMSKLPPEVPITEIPALWQTYRAHGNLAIRDRIFEGLMRKVYMWCWPYTSKYTYGDDALAASYEALGTALETCADIPYLRVRCVGACVNYINDNQPSVRRSGAVTEISIDDITKLDTQGTAVTSEYGVEDLILELRLDPMEDQILRLTLDGLTTPEIGIKINYSRRQVLRILTHVRTLIARKHNYRRPGWSLPPLDT